MSLELHAWGPAFGLPSVDPDCLAAVAYFSLAIPRDAWTLVATSPSALPRTLPALRDAQSRQWVAAGFEPIVAYMRTLTLPSVVDLDAGLTPRQAADSTAFAAFLHAEAAPLLALSLYVSSANWAATTRPAYGRILPFPLTWIEPPAVRAAHVSGASHLGLSSLQTDEDAPSSSSEGGLSTLSAAIHAFPDRLRATGHADKATGTAAAASMPSIPLAASHLTVSSALTPEAKHQIRLDDAARTCLSVLAKRKGNKRSFLRADNGDGDDDDKESGVKQSLRPTSLDCLAFGYLALMVTPDVPRPFLREAMRRHYHELLVFVADMRQACFGGDSTLLPSPSAAAPAAPASLALSPSAPPNPRHLNPLWLRSIHGVIHSVPGLSGEWLVWLWRRIRVADEDDKDGDMAGPWRRDVAAARRQRIVTLCSTLAGTALAVATILGFRRLPAYGLPVVVYRAPPPLLGLGAAGALLAAL